MKWMSNSKKGTGNMKILLVDDEQIKRTALRDDLLEAGYDTHTATCAEEGLQHLRAAFFDVVVTDLRMKAMDGMTFMQEIKRHWPETEIIMMTAYATVDNAVQAMKLGAFDYITKPFESEKLILVIEKLARLHALKTENASLKSELAKMTGNVKIIGQSEAMQKTLDQIDIAVACDAPVLLCGETGTGKELCASAIHHRGARKKKPFIRLSCAALSEQLMESELFGHERGSFTGAVDGKPGRFELADKGTLFLDEIDDVPMSIQVKLLRVLEGHPFERVGGVVPIQTDVRIVAASKVNLRKRVAENMFRSDLFYRLNVFPIFIPPLRERREDIPLLVDHFLGLYSNRNTPPAILEDAMTALWNYNWPGNVRELQNVVRRVLLGIGDRVEVRRQDLPQELRSDATGDIESARYTHADDSEAGRQSADSMSFRKTIETNERAMLMDALTHSDGNQSRAAAALNIKLSTFRDKLAKYGIRPPEIKQARRNRS